MLCIENLSIKSNDNTLIKTFSHSFTPGIHYITGYSGSGKSTLMDAICGVSNHDIYGRISYNNNLISCDMVSHLETSFKMYDFLTFKQLLTFSSFMPKNDNGLLENILPLMNGIDRDRYIHTLSSGQKKRCKLVIDFIRKKNIFCLDEPYANLSENDQKIVTQAVLDVEKINKNAIILICTHHENLILENKTRIDINNGNVSLISKTTLTDVVHLPTETPDEYYSFYMRIYNLLRLEYFYSKKYFFITNIAHYI